MTQIAILHPMTLLGKEVQLILGDRPELWNDIRLVSISDHDVGRLTGVGQVASVVVEATPDDLAGVDVLFACGDPEDDRPFLDGLSPGALGILLSPETEPGAAPSVISGINSEAADAGGVFLSPHPGAILLAHLLRPLSHFGLTEVTATIIQPVSIHGSKALDVLLDNTRDVFSMKGETSELFDRQIAFNVLPARTPGRHVSAEVTEVLGLDVPVSAQILQGAVFHSMSVSLHVELSADAEEVRDALADSPYVEIFESPDILGPIDASTESEVLVGHVTQDRPGSLWIWATMDNLTRGGALNAVEIANRRI